METFTPWGLVVCGVRYPCLGSSMGTNFSNGLSHCLGDVLFRGQKIVCVPVCRRKAKSYPLGNVLLSPKSLCTNASESAQISILVYVLLCTSLPENGQIARCRCCSLRSTVFFVRNRATVCMGKHMVIRMQFRPIARSRQMLLTPPAYSPTTTWLHLAG